MSAGVFLALVHVLANDVAFVGASEGVLWDGRSPLVGVGVKHRVGPLQFARAIELGFPGIAVEVCRDSAERQDFRRRFHADRSLHTGYALAPGGTITFRNSQLLNLTVDTMVIYKE